MTTTFALRSTASPREQIRHDEAFQNLLYERSGDPLLAQTARMHWRFLRRVMGHVLRQAESPRTIWRQHAELFELIAAGDSTRAEALAVQALTAARTDGAGAAGASAA